MTTKLKFFLMLTPFVFASLATASNQERRDRLGEFGNLKVDTTPFSSAKRFGVPPSPAPSSAAVLRERSPLPPKSSISRVASWPQLPDRHRTSMLSTFSSGSISTSTYSSPVSSRANSLVGDDIQVEHLQFDNKEKNKLYHVDKTGLPSDFLVKLKNFPVHFFSIRLQSNPLEVSPRRYSFGDEVAEVSPKQTDMSTKTLPLNRIGHGHIPRNSEWSPYPYSLLDHNAQGAFPEGSRPIGGWVKILKNEDSSYIQEIRQYKNLLCIAERVPKYISVAGREIRTGETHIKHYIQETETLESVMIRISKGVYIFVKASERELEFSDSFHNAILDLTRLLSKPSTSADDRLFVNWDAFRDFVQAEGLNGHGPIFYKNHQEVRLPLFMAAGRNGFHVAADTDSLHAPIPAWMPPIAYRAFNGRNTEPEIFIAGLKILRARLISETKEDFTIALNLLGLNLKQSITFFKDMKWGPGAVTDNDKQYCEKVIVPVIDKTIELYERTKDFSGVGLSRIYDLFVIQAFEHPLLVHGPDDLYPGSQPGAFGATLIAYRNELYLTSNEASYLAFLMHDPLLLENARVLVHPYWLQDTHLYKEDWLDLLELQALVSYKNGHESYQVFKRIIEESFQLNRKGEEAALAAVKKRLQGIDGLDEVAIKGREDAIYKLHEDAIEQIELDLLANEGL